MFFRRDRRRTEPLRTRPLGPARATDALMIERAPALGVRREESEPAFAFALRAKRGLRPIVYVPDEACGRSFGFPAEPGLRLS
jgi:hypothetical protein